MKTIGLLLKEGRLKSNLSIEEIADETKIKKEFIEAIEKEKWKDLPDYTVVVGFIKNIASFIGLEPKDAIAFLRRDYPPKKNEKYAAPQQAISSRFHWSPRLTFALLAGFIILMIGGYLLSQYLHFVSPPVLSLLEPKENAIVTQTNLKIVGVTDPEASLKVNNQPVIVKDDGSFEAEIEINATTSKIEVRAISRAGKETTLVRTIKPKLK